MLLLAAAAAGPDLALLQAAALVPAQVPPVDPVHLGPAALVLLALVPPLLPVPLALPAPAADAMTTVDAPAQRPKHRRGEMIKREGKEAQAPNQLKFT